MAEDLGAVADAYGLDRFAIIGVSGGAPYAVAAAASMPDRISLLAFVCPVGEIADNGAHSHVQDPRDFCSGGWRARPVATRAFFRSLRTMVFSSPETAYRWLMRPRERVGPGALGALPRSERA